MIRIFRWLLFLPFQLGLLTLFTLTELLRWIRTGFDRKSDRVSQDFDGNLCSVVVLNWNGRHLLEESLPPLLKAVQYCGKQHEIIVVDNGSTDDSVAWLREHFPRVVRVELETNLGFGEGNNRGVEAAQHDIVVLLNNDMIVSEDFLPPLLEVFSDPDVFAVSSQILFPEGLRQEETGNTQGVVKHGYLHLSHQPLSSYHYRRKCFPVLWAGGGSSAFHRARFLEAGGFSDLYSPCYLEDTDLSYRAWRRGWRVLLAPESKVLHKHRSTTKVRFGDEELNSLIEERKLWYLWSNFQLRTLLKHLLLFPIHLNQQLSPAEYIRAWRRLPWVLGQRFLEPRRSVGDRLLMRWVQHPLEYLNQFFPERRKLSRCPGDPLKILVVSAYLPHLGTHGGAGRVFQLLKRVSRKHEISLITFVENQSDESFLPQVEPYCNRIETVPRNSYVPLSFFPYEPFEEFNSAEFLKKMEDLLTGEDFDIIHFEWTQMALFSDLAPYTRKLLTEIEVNYAAHRTMMAVEPSLLKKLRKLYNTLQTLYRELEMCRRVDHIVCVTDEDRGYLTRYLPSQTLSVVNTGVDIDHFLYAPEIAQPQSLVFVGAFRHSPNVDAMLYFCDQILPEILKAEPETRLYIVGSSPTDEVLRLGEHPSITVTGFVEDIYEYYRRAQVVIVPLRTGVGIRGKILEAWAVGKATVATRLACQGISAAHGENILVADTPEEFSKWTISLLRKPELCRTLGKSGRRTVEDFYDWNIIGEKMIRKYESLADS